MGMMKGLTAIKATAAAIILVCVCLVGPAREGCGWLARASALAVGRPGMLGRRWYRAYSLISSHLLICCGFRMLVDCCSCKPVQLWGQQEFVVPQFVLDIIYGQTVCWIGTFFCPFLPLLNTIKYFIIFYMKKITLFSNCKPADRTFRASSANFFFLLVLLLGLAISWVPVLYSMFGMTPSKVCGPFRNQVHIWDTISSSVETLPEVAKQFFQFIGSQAFVIPLFFLSCIVLFYLMALGSSYGMLVSRLKEQLQMERNRKIFLNQAY